MGGEVTQFTLFRRLEHDLAVLSYFNEVFDEVTVIIDFRRRGGNDLALFLRSRKIDDFTGNDTVFNGIVRRFDKPVLVYFRVRSQCIDQTDILTLRGLDRTDTSVMRRVNVTDFKARTLFHQTALTQRGETTLVRDFRKRVRLIHKL